MGFLVFLSNSKLKNRRGELNFCGMLENRDYMRAPSFEPRRQVTLILLAVNALVFITQILVGRAAPEFPFNKYFALSVHGLSEGYVWQLITFQFLHGGWLHLLLNSWGIYVFGRAVEDAIGGVRWWQLYLASGVIGGLVQLLCSLALPNFFGDAGVVGASGGLFGLIGAFATLFPHERLTLLLFFVLPVTITARALVIISAIIAVLGLAMHADNVAHAAHLGGMLAGVLFIKLMMEGRWPTMRRPRRRITPREFANVTAKKFQGWKSGTPDADLPPEEFISREVDPILDKISAHGLQSLTERERKILDAARKKMEKR